ncbi:MAG: CopD family protein [Lautropia sp.]
MAYLAVKTLHLIFVISYFAGIFYLPRIFVNLAMVPAGSTAERDRLLGMARRLLRFMMPLAVIVLASGLWLWLAVGIGKGPGSGWLHAKLALVVLLFGYHHGCARLLRRFEAGGNTRSDRWYRVFNEVPVLLLALIVVLVVFKPF